MPRVKPKTGWVRWFRLALWAVLAAGVAFGAKEVNGFFRHDPRFRLANIEIEGAVYSNRARIQSVFAADLEGSIFRVPLAERRRRLLAIDWVKTATISRIWPDKILITITERTPVAFAKLYRLALIDGDGVLLALPPRVRFRLPVLSGITEEQTEAERRVRVMAMQHLLDDLGPQAKEISEINASDPEDMRVIAGVGNRGVELWLGDEHYRARYMNFATNYPEIRKHSERETVFDLRMDDRILAK